LLKLKKVELHGFKSFCDRTELRFRGDGIAAVVGPNGCGKSNLSDAISWVLGEQSAKSLRGARMEDVIFGGTRERKPLGMASVTMTLLDPTANRPVEAPDQPVEITVVPLEENGHNGHNGHNGNGHGPEAHAKNVQVPTPAHVTPGEITITRRLFRSGESEYLINGRAARLRDIQDLFMGSGLGPESYAIIEQGRIGQILSSRPYDRRAVIEEAAGITKFKSRKRLAEAKLESAKQNLARVFDILEEVTRQVNSLKRQASRTKRYGEMKTEMDTRLRTLLGARSQQLEAEVAQAAADLEAASRELRDASSQVAESEKSREDLQASCYDLEARLTEARKGLADLNVEAERTRGKLEAQVKESGAIETRMTRNEGESQELENRLAQVDSEQAALAETVSMLEGQITSLRGFLSAKNQDRETLQNRVRAQEGAIEEGRVLVLRLLGEAATLKNQLAQIDEFLAGIDRETTRARREEEGASAEVARLAGAREAVSADLARHQSELESVTAERKRTESELAGHKQQAAELRGVVDQLRGECSRVRARKESLENVLAHHSYTTETVKRLLGAIERNGNGLKPHGVLADFVEVEPRFERAAEEFLHHELEFVVMENWQQAEAGMQILRADLEGRATFVVEQAEPAAGQPLPELALDRLAEHVRFSNGLSAQAASLFPRLKNCFLAESVDQARDLATAHPELYFLLEDGRCYQGSTLTGGRKKSSGPLALKREVRELATALANAELKLNARVQTQEDLGRQIGELESGLDGLRQAQQTREKDAVALQAEQRKLTEEHNRAQSRISVARLELERLECEKERSSEQRARNGLAVAQKEEQRTERERALEAARTELESVDAEAHQVREEHSALRAELAGLEERFRAQSAALQRLDAQSREIIARRQNLASEIERLGEHRSRLLEENIELDQRVSQLAEDVLHVEAQVAELANLETGQRSALAAADEALKELRTRIEAGHLRKSEVEVELVRRESELRFLDETSRKDLGVPLSELEKPEGELDAEGMAEAERLYREVKDRIEALGPINPSALEEYEVALQRQEFLTVQRKDLIDSIRDTEKAIGEIDEVSKARFVEAFEAINKNFRECFTTLFGGGTGEMRLTDEENANESGIDIVASPPGKKLQNVLLLSGGEKALAALALLMAIFRYQPSPFCVLDEVDAPLDEANIVRLTRLLREMSMETQFIVITHSKKTMESAQSMYGVTMQEAGVSKLVSVKFHGEREVVREAAVA
jgi:chromosome segregation protein